MAQCGLVLPSRNRPTSKTYAFTVLPNYCYLCAASKQHYIVHIFFFFFFKLDGLQSFPKASLYVIQVVTKNTEFSAINHTDCLCCNQTKQKQHPS